MAFCHNSDQHRRQPDCVDSQADLRRLLFASSNINCRFFDYILQLIFKWHSVKAAIITDANQTAWIHSLINGLGKVLLHLKKHKLFIPYVSLSELA